jgi:quercetin dioxygenase-like cupin family protein
MSDPVRETITGDGFAVGSIDGLGEGPGFRKVRRELGVEAFGVNAIVMPPGFQSNRHFHDEQEELYVVLRGTFEIELNDGEKHVLAAGGLARVDPPTVRRLRNLSDTDEAVYLCIGGKGGYVGRDGRVPEGDDPTMRGGRPGGD